MRIFAIVSLALLLAAAILLANFQSSLPPEPAYQGKPVSAWALDLNDPSADARELASNAAKNFGAEAVPSLVRLLRTPDPLLARPVRAVEGALPAKIRGVLFRTVRPHEASAKRAAAAQALRLMGTNSASALPALSRALRDDQTAAWHAALALAQLGEQGTDILSVSLPDLLPSQANYACYALGTQGTRASKAIPALASALQSNAPGVREAAARALRNIGSPGIQTLVQALDDKNQLVRLLAIRTLAEVGPPARKAAPKLVTMLEADLPMVRTAAADALSKIQPGAR